MRAFIDVVMRQACGDEPDKLRGHARLLLEQLPGTPLGSTDSRKPGVPEQCEPLASLTAKPVIEPLHPQHMDALAPPAVEPIERDPVAGCVERRRQLPSQGDLLLLDGPPIRGEEIGRASCRERVWQSG